MWGWKVLISFSFITGTLSPYRSKGRIYIEFNCFRVHRKLITILLEQQMRRHFTAFSSQKKIRILFAEINSRIFLAELCFFFFSITGRNIYVKRMLLGIPVGSDILTAEKRRIPKVYEPFLLYSFACKLNTKKKKQGVLYRFFFITHA